MAPKDERLTPEAAYDLGRQYAQQEADEDKRREAILSTPAIVAAGARVTVTLAELQKAHLERAEFDAIPHDSISDEEWDRRDSAIARRISHERKNFERCLKRLADLQVEQAHFQAAAE